MPLSTYAAKHSYPRNIHLSNIMRLPEIFERKHTRAWFVSDIIVLDDTKCCIVFICWYKPVPAQVHARVLIHRVSVQIHHEKTVLKQFVSKWQVPEQ